MKLLNVHVLSTCVLHVEYTLKGYTFVCTHTHSIHVKTYTKYTLGLSGVSVWRVFQDGRQVNWLAVQGLWVNTEEMDRLGLDY